MRASQVPTRIPMVMRKNFRIFGENCEFAGITSVKKQSDEKKCLTLCHFFTKQHLL